MDDKFTDIEIKRGRLMGKKTEYLGQFDLVADVDAHYAFTEFGYHSDAIYASLKILEFMVLHKMNFSKILEHIEDFFYFAISLSCPAATKGKVMRLFMEEGKNYTISHLDGIKITFEKNEWVLMIPDDHTDLVHLYVQSFEQKRGEDLKERYVQKMKEWISEDM